MQYLTVYMQYIGQNSKKTDEDDDFGDPLQGLLLTDAMTALCSEVKVASIL